MFHEGKPANPAGPDLALQTILLALIACSFGDAVGPIHGIHWPVKTVSYSSLTRNVSIRSAHVETNGMPSHAGRELIHFVDGATMDMFRFVHAGMVFGFKAMRTEVGVDFPWLTRPSAPNVLSWLVKQRRSEPGGREPDSYVLDIKAGPKRVKVTMITSISKIHRLGPELEAWRCPTPASGKHLNQRLS